ncbi:immunoglobulin kappa light chain-like isoform 2-T2 [Tautogolabrus adspersus]
MMTCLRLALYLTGFCLWRIALTTGVKLSFNVRQERSFVLANVGDSVTLQCFFEGDVAAMFFWYKQALGQKPRLISSFYKHDSKGTFSEEFKDNSRFKLETKDGNNHLKISNVITSDSATYYCVSSYAYSFQFAEGTTLSVKGSGWNIPALVHQSESETIQPGGSVTLNCTVQTGTCDGEHSVYWFRNSEESHPGLIYTHGGGNDQCVRKPNTHTCVYNLKMETLNLSHAGTYYCAVATCGHILFGNGTKLDLASDPPVLVYILSTALAFTTILVALLAFSLYKMNCRNCICTEDSSPATTVSILHYQVIKQNMSLLCCTFHRKDIFFVLSATSRPRKPTLCCLECP